MNNKMKDSLEFIYDTEANAINKLKDVIPEDGVNRLLDIMYSPNITDKKIGWGLLFGMDIEHQHRKDIIAELFATCDPVKHLHDMFTSYQEIIKEWENQ
jgi:hypothetical protein